VRLSGRGGKFGSFVLRPPTTPEPVTRASSPARLPIATLLVLSPIGAELLAAYSDSTGRPGDVLFALVFFAALYGCPALLTREVVRRTNRGWPSLLLVAAALGVLQAGVIDQSIFAEEDDTVRGWNESVRRTYVYALGVSAFNSVQFAIGHVIFSFAAPIAIAEAIRPAVAHRPWLRRRGLIVATFFWLSAAALIVTDLEPGDAHRGTALEVASAFTLALALILAALLVARPRRPAPGRPRASVRSAAAGGFVAATAIAVLPDTWLGVALFVPLAIASALWLARAASAEYWSLTHAAAVATGALVSRGALAFLYYPLVGEVDALPKYAHNVVMLAVVATAGAVAVQRAARTRKNWNLRRSAP
jgi:hypothetical protein